MASDLEDEFDVEEEDAEPLFADDVDALDDPPPLPPPMPSLSQLRQQSSTQHHSTPPGTEVVGVAPGRSGETAAGGNGEQAPPAKKRKPLLTLTTDRIFSDKGLPYIESEFPKLKFKGKGHEVSDIKFLLKQYEMWANRMYPKYTFQDVLKRIERLSTTKDFKSQLIIMRRRHVPSGPAAVTSQQSTPSDGEMDRSVSVDERPTSQEPTSSTLPATLNAPLDDDHASSSDEDLPTMQGSQQLESSQHDRTDDELERQVLPEASTDFEEEWFSLLEDEQLDIAENEKPPAGMCTGDHSSPLEDTIYAEERPSLLGDDAVTETPAATLNSSPQLPQLMVGQGQDHEEGGMDLMKDSAVSTDICSVDGRPGSLPLSDTADSEEWPTLARGCNHSLPFSEDFGTDPQLNGMAVQHLTGD